MNVNILLSRIRCIESMGLALYCINKSIYISHLNRSPENVQTPGTNLGPINRVPTILQTTIANYVVYLASAVLPHGDEPLLLHIVSRAPQPPTRRRTERIGENGAILPNAGYRTWPNQRGTVTPLRCLRRKLRHSAFMAFEAPSESALSKSDCRLP